MEEKLNRSVNRRRLLRGAGVAAAGVAGVAAAGAVGAAPAEAATGSFDSASLTAAAVTLTNSGNAVEGAYLRTGPHLQLVPQDATSGISATAPAGSIAMDGDGIVWLATGTPGFMYRDFVYTSGVSNMTLPVTPSRAFDSDPTKNLRGRLLNGTSAYTAEKVKGYTWVHLDLTGYVKFGQTVICGVQAVNPVAGGYLSVGPYIGWIEPKPTWANLNFMAGSTQSGLVFSAIGPAVQDTQVPTDVISIFASTNVRIIVDIYAFVVDSPGRIVEYGGGSGLKAAGPNAIAKRRALIAQHPA